MSEYRCVSSATDDYLAFHATQRPNALAVVDCGREITYAQFQRDLGRFVRAVNDIGLDPGRSVAVAWDELYPHWLLLLACERLGLVTATFGEPEAPLLKTVDLVLSEVRPPDVTSERHHAVTQEWLASVFSSADAEMLPAAPRRPDHAMRIVQTSGTTGQPKRILLTRQMFSAWVERRIWSLDLTRKSRALITTAFTAGCYTLATAVIRAGGTIFYTGSKIGAAAAIAGAVQGITHMRLTPLELKLVLDNLPAEFTKPAGLVICTVGAAVSASLRERTLARLASELMVTYGSNEVLFAAETRATGSEGVSIVYPWVEMEVVDDRDLPLPPGTPGKIRIRDEAMATGYLDDPGATAQKFRNGWFYPGDIGISHGPRRIQIVGREDELLNIGGVKMAPNALETLVLQHATVDDVGVCTTQNAEGIDEICVVIVNPGHGDAELLERITAAFRNLQLGRFDIIKSPKIPRNANGKIQRNLLKKAAATSIGRTA